MSLVYIGFFGPVLVTYLGLFDPPGTKSNRSEITLIFDVQLIADAAHVETKVFNRLNDNHLSFPKWLIMKAASSRSKLI